MPEMKVLSDSVALLGDLVASREAQRPRVHEELLHAIDETNRRVPSLDSVRVTVGDEVQGVYASMGHALQAALVLRDELFGTADMRFGIGGGDVRIIDGDRGIQDGNAWWLARDAIDFVETLSRQSGYEGVRTAIRDERPAAIPAADAISRLVDVHLASLRDGARRSLIGLLRGLDNTDVAEAEGISPSANTQRVKNNDLQALADAILALHTLP